MSAARNQKRPSIRKLRGYAFDPSMSLTLDTVTINEIVYKVVWEDLFPGPVGEYLEVLDYDPTIKQLYNPVDLNEPYALEMDGLDPSEANPHFHQQMVYAVAMTTIRNFELGLGRKVLWAPRRPPVGPDNRRASYEYVQRLRIYPHALREANAYYSPQKKALLFGYFEAMPADKTLHMPDSLVYTCLSHDIIAHETTHAILDGMYPFYNEPTNPDVLAFHEAFADIVALFQHFTFPEVLKHQIARTRGRLESQNLLGQLAQEFGSAIGSYGSLRDAIGHMDKETNKWVPTKPDPKDYESEMEPHARGSILVAAVFDAFIRIYKYQVQDLLRIATNGSGILSEGELHPDLINRLSAEAARCSQRVLHMCIRALDYCPPVDLTFGDFLRGIITADLDLRGEDQHEFRLAFIESFRHRGIYPQGIRAMSVDCIAHPSNPVLPDADELLDILSNFLREYRAEVQYSTNRQEIYDKSKNAITGDSGLHSRLNSKIGASSDLQKLSRLAWRNWGSVGVADSRAPQGGPRFEVQNLRLVSRTSPKGDQINNIVFSLIQRAGVKVHEGELEPIVLEQSEDADSETMLFRGGCTFVFDLDELKLKYVITKPLLAGTDPTAPVMLNEERVRAQYEYQYETGPNSVSEFQAYFGQSFAKAALEPFALLHQH